MQTTGPANVWLLLYEYILKHVYCLNLHPLLKEEIDILTSFDFGFIIEGLFAIDYSPYLYLCILAICITYYPFCYFTDFILHLKMFTEAVRRYYIRTTSLNQR